MTLLNLPPDAKALCAVSGGADSVALLHMCVEWRDQGRLAGLGAAHFHHGLRGAAADADERFVRTLCAAWDVPYFVGQGDASAAAKERGMGIEEAARALRYAFLESAAQEAGADIILTAHNADDNLETMLLNLVRGTGLDGLCGIPTGRQLTMDNGQWTIVRPLLGMTRAEILAYLEKHDIAFREDESNADMAFTRNRIRHQVLPILRDINPNAAGAAFQAAALLRADAAYLKGLADEQADAFAVAENGAIRFPAQRLSGLPPALAGRVARALFGRIGWRGPSADHVQAVLDICASGSPHAAAPLPKGWAAYREYGDLRVCRVPDAEHQETVNFRLTVRDIGPYDPGIVYKSFNPFYVASDTIVGAIRARARQTGDRLALQGKTGTKSVSRLMIDKKIPLSKRDRLAVLEDGAGVIAAEGLGVDRSRAPREGSHVLEVTAGEHSPPLLK